MRIPFFLAAFLAALAARAQAPAATYQVQRDSLWAHAQRIRTQTAARTAYFGTGFMGIGGTRRIITSVGRMRVRPVTDLGSRVALLKREVVKHKTHGAEIRKVTYYGPGGDQQLYEYYEGGHLTRLELFGYAVAGPASGPPADPTFCTMRWVRGDYLSVGVRSRRIGGRLVSQQYYAAPPAPLPVP